MRFQERELKPYADPIPAGRLNEGSVYFFVNFADDDMLIPTLEPVVFIGRNLDPDDEGLVYFQDFDSYHQGIRYGSPPSKEQAIFHCGREDQTSHIFEFEQALEELMRCFIRRKNAAP